jgi:hypothetical protein
MTDQPLRERTIRLLRAVAYGPAPAPRGLASELLREWETAGFPAPSADALVALQARLQEVERELEREGAAHGVTIDQRDRAESAADELAYAIADVDTIGEHSNLNDPWANALDELATIQERAEAWEVLDRCRALDQEKVQRLTERADAAERDLATLRTQLEAAKQELGRGSAFCSWCDWTHQYQVGTESQDRAAAAMREHVLSCPNNPNTRLADPASLFMRAVERAESAEAKVATLRTQLEAVEDGEHAFKCRAEKPLDPPQECNWPFCGCDPYAEKVLDAIPDQPICQGCELLKQEIATLRTELEAAEQVLDADTSAPPRLKGGLVARLEMFSRTHASMREAVLDRAEATEHQFATLRTERDEYRTLAAIGTWHAECRPNRHMAARELQKSQAVIDKLADTISALRTAIRAHRDARGDDRCWRDDEELYAVLPEGYTPPARDTAVELDRCRAFIASRQNPKTEYVSPEREIERLRTEQARLQRERLTIIAKLHGNTPQHGAFPVDCDIWPCSLVEQSHLFVTSEDRRVCEEGECILCGEVEAHGDHVALAGLADPTDGGTPPLLIPNTQENDDDVSTRTGETEVTPSGRATASANEQARDDYEAWAEGYDEARWPVKGDIFAATYEAVDEGRSIDARLTRPNGSQATGSALDLSSSSSSLVPPGPPEDPRCACGHFHGCHNGIWKGAAQTCDHCDCRTFREGEAASAPAPASVDVWILRQYADGGVRGVFASQVGAQAEIKAICDEHPDLRRQDFVLQVERIRGERT